MNATQETKVMPHNESAAPQVSTPTSIASNNAGAPAAPMANIANKINSSGLPNVLLVVRSMIMKPVTAVKEELPKIETLKDAAIIGALCTLIATSFSALTT